MNEKGEAMEPTANFLSDDCYDGRKEGRQEHQDTAEEMLSILRKMEDLLVEARILMLKIMR